MVYKERPESLRASTQIQQGRQRSMNDLQDSAAYHQSFLAAHEEKRSV